MVGIRVRSSQERRTVRREPLWRYSGGAQDTSVWSRKTATKQVVTVEDYTWRRVGKTVVAAYAPFGVNTRTGNPWKYSVEGFRTVMKTRLNNSLDPLDAASGWFVGYRQMLLMLGDFGYYRPFHAGQGRPQTMQWTGLGRLLLQTQQDTGE